MRKLLDFIVFLAFINFATSINNPTTNIGVEINVKVNEDVPNHLCARFFKNLEVRN